MVIICRNVSIVFRLNEYVFFTIPFSFITLFTTSTYFSTLWIRCKLTRTSPCNFSFCSQQRPPRRITHVSSTNIKTPISISSEPPQLEHFYEGNMPKRVAKVQVPPGMSRSSNLNRVSPTLISHYHCHHYWPVFIYCIIIPFPVFPFLCLTLVSFTLLRQRFQYHISVLISYQFWFSQILYYINLLSVLNVTHDLPKVISHSHLSVWYPHIFLFSF